MNGSRLLLDTNAVVAVLRGNKQVLEYVQNASWIGISIITSLEFRCFKDLSSEDQSLFDQFILNVDVIGLTQEDTALIDRILEIRRTSRLKLPDAIVAATCLSRDATLVSADRQFNVVHHLPMLSFLA
jgi:predicted nucleic acid-binding protein